MKKTLLVSLTCFCLLSAFSQQMRVKQYNFTTFNEDKKNVTPLLDKKSSELAKKHPEYGILPYNAQCADCIEEIDKRTAYTREYIDSKRNNYTLSQSSYFPLHYQKSKNDSWHSIDIRLRPDTQHPGVYIAKDQIVPTKIDVNRHLTSLNANGFEFEFNKSVDMYFFDENSIYTQSQSGNYSNYTIGEEGMKVKNIWSGIDLELTVAAGKVKSNYKIESPLQLPISKGWMVIEDHFTLPNGYTFEEATTGERLDGIYYRGDYIIKNELGDTLITYEKPIYVDAKAFGMHGVYHLMQDGNNYVLQMLVPVEWMNKPENTYPLSIDPNVVSGVTKIGNFRQTGLLSGNMAFTTQPPSCNYNMTVVVPGMSTLTNAYVDLEYQLTYDNTCGIPPEPPPFCTFAQVTQEVICDPCGSTTGFLVCNPANPPFTGTCTTDSNLVPGAHALLINSFNPTYMTCIAPQCPDYNIPFTLKNRDQMCVDVCGYLCARGNMWQMTVEACRVGGNITQSATQICVGQPVTFTAHPNCGVPPYHYIWSYVDTSVVIDTIFGTTTITVYPTQNIDMGCTIVDFCGQQWVTNDLSVTVTPSPPADAGPDQTLCQGGTLIIGGSPTTSGGATVSWTGSTPTVQSWLSSTTAFNPSITVPAGTIDSFFYVVTATTFTCSRTDTVWIFSLPNPVANAGPDQALCGGGTVTIGGSPTSNGAPVVWTGETPTVESWLSSTTASNPTVNVPIGTIDTFFYVVTATAGNCVASDTVYVFSNPSPIPDAGPDVSLCQGGVANIGGSPTAPGGATIVWTGENLTFEGYLSSTTAANPTATVPAGTIDTFFYVVKATAFGCSRTDTMYIFSNPNPTADAGMDQSLCAGGLVTIGGNPTSIPAATTTWTGRDATVQSWLSSTTVSNPQVNVPNGTVDTFFYVVTAAVGPCIATDTVYIFSNPSPLADAGPDGSLCEGGVVNLGGNPTASGGGTILWSGENVTVEGYLNSTTAANPVATVPAGTVDTFFYVVTVTGLNCSKTDTVYVFSNPNPGANAGNDTSLCSGGVVSLGGNPTTMAGANIIWAGQDANAQSYLNNANIANPTATVPAGTVATFFYAVTTSIGNCVSTDTMIVTSNVTPTTNAGPDVQFCEGGTAIIGGNPTTTNATTTVWTGQSITVEGYLSSTTAQNPTATVPQGTVNTFFYAVTAANGNCMSSDTMMVYSYANPNAIIDSSGPTKLCNNQSVNLSVVGNYVSYIWNTGSTNPTINVNQTGAYYAVVTDLHGCVDTSNIIPVFSATLSPVIVYPDTTIMIGNSVMLYTNLDLTASMIDSFIWNPNYQISCLNCPNPIVNPEDNSWYGITVYAGGCTVTDSALIQVIQQNNFFIPNAFTPNGDGNNDLFFIEAQRGVSVLSFQVWNRWGEKVYDDLYPWDGTYKGKPAPQGVYIYVFKLAIHGENLGLFRKGSVTLIR